MAKPKRGRTESTYGNERIISEARGGGSIEGACYITLVIACVTLSKGRRNTFKGYGNHALAGGKDAATLWCSESCGCVVATLYDYSLSPPPSSLAPIPLLRPPLRPHPPDPIPSPPPPVTQTRCPYPPSPLHPLFVALSYTPHTHPIPPFSSTANNTSINFHDFFLPLIYKISYSDVHCFKEPTPKKVTMPEIFCHNLEISSKCSLFLAKETER